MPERPILLKALLRQKHWQKYATFCREYDKAAQQVDPDLQGTYPSRAQLHRWLSGDLKGLPYPDHCRVLEEMFPGRPVERLFSPCPPDLPGAQHVDEAANEMPASAATDAIGGRLSGQPTNRLCDVSAAFASRAEFVAALPPHVLLDGAREVRAAGLSLNMLCQQYPDQHLMRLIADGATIQCLFLDPDGAGIKAREREEGHPEGHVATLTRLNIQVLCRLRDRLTAPERSRFEIAVYDETIRFNIFLIDGVTCIVQPYLPDARGVDSPTLVIERTGATQSLYPVFDQVFSSLWERSKPI